MDKSLLACPATCALATQTCNIWEQVSIVWGAAPVKNGKSAIIRKRDNYQIEVLTN